MSAPTIAKTLAARLWADLPGDPRDKAHLLKSVIAELRSARDADLIEHRRNSRVHAPHKLRTPIDNKIAKLIGQPPTKAHQFRIPILGINTPVCDVFTMAAMPGHPLREACQAFLDEHRLSLTVLEKKPGKKGRAPTIITQAPPPSPTPAEILERVKATTARFMGRDCTAGIVTYFPPEAIERGDDQ